MTTSEEQRAVDGTAWPAVIGIDAGGTRTRAALARAAADGGPPLRTGVSGPGNALSVPLDVLTSHLRQAVAAATPPWLRPRVRAVAAGLAGCSALPGNAGAAHARSALRAALTELGIRPEVVTVLSDTEIALAGAPGSPGDGLVLIAGTGAVAARITGGITVATADGNGWLLGDSGSGFWLGREAVRSALASLDGRGAPTALTPAVLAHYLGEMAPDEPATPAAAQRLRDRLVRAVHERPVVDLACLAPLVAQTADRGDPVARRLLSGAAEHLVDTLDALSPRPGQTLVTTGGLLGPGGVLLGPLTRRLAPRGLRPVPVPDGLAGAVALARKALAGTGRPRGDPAG
ncbi:N-acetylglucosamine kinase [Streptomyces thermodiastaticus]|uniref:N-acetylglucosamine kinase n=1 Tax=Streptomyces thermodiastaticus TaxID=44061 RepID=UPI001674FC0F|nr:BadF/BadG/BcrA/BcrD ATPase family protein [Streptomyces thermodiastaticus]MCE7548924.1 ATPase [Streptomyces thermodiastaticus]GHF75375.1 N-acetylglucosamine kinase [Streptomyces thermodiastaticus]